MFNCHTYVYIYNCIIPNPTIQLWRHYWIIYKPESITHPSCFAYLAQPQPWKTAPLWMIYDDSLYLLNIVMFQFANVKEPEGKPSKIHDILCLMLRVPLFASCISWLFTFTFMYSYPDRQMCFSQCFPKCWLMSYDSYDML